MGMIHGKTSAGKVIPVHVDAAGNLNVSTTPGAISLTDVTIEGLFGGLGEHWNGAATDTPATVTFSDTSRSILIDNIDADDDLYFSLDAGTTWKKLPPESSLNLCVDQASIQVKAGAGLTADYEIIAVVAE